MTTTDDITRALNGYASALHARDLDQILSFFTADAVVMAPQVPTAEGPGVRDLYAQIIAALDLDITFAIEAQVASDDDQVAVFTQSTGTQTTVGDGSSAPEANREAFVFVAEGGEWKIARYLFNTVH